MCYYVYPISLFFQLIFSFIVFFVVGFTSAKEKVKVYGILGGTKGAKVPLEVKDLGKPYEFEYVVNTHPVNNAHSRKEVSNGNVVKGEYRVRMSDGRTQIVR